MARVAAELGFTTMSLYRYVASKEELLQLMWNASARGAEDLVLEGDGWRARLRMWAIVQREVLDRHPWLTQMPMAAPPVAPNSLIFVESGLETMDGTPLADADKLRFIGLISSYTLSEARMFNDALRAAREQLAAAGSGGGEAAPPWTFDALLRELVDEKTYPRLYRIAWTPAEGDDGSGEGGGPPSEREEFLFGIDRILDGIQAYMDQTALRLGAVPGPVRDRQAGRDVGVVRMGQRHLVHRPFDVGADRRAELRVGRPARVVGRQHEAVGEPAAEVAHVPVARVQQQQVALVAAVLPRVPGRPAHGLGQVGGQPLDVLRVLARVRERVVELRVRQAAGVQRGGETREGPLAARELVQRRSHGSILGGTSEGDPPVGFAAAPCLDTSIGKL